MAPTGVPPDAPFGVSTWPSPRAMFVRGACTMLSLLSLSLALTLPLASTPAPQFGPDAAAALSAPALVGMPMAATHHDGTPPFTFFNVEDCDEILIENYTDDVQYFLATIDCDGDGVADEFLREDFFVPDAWDKGPGALLIDKHWWAPCEIVELVYLEPAGGGDQGQVVQVAPCHFIIL